METDKKKIRIFIAFELSHSAKEELIRVIDVLTRAGANVKWIRPDAIHLTLKFLGDTSIEKIEKIKVSLEKIAKSTPSFDIVLGGIGVFPDWRHTKVIWVGIEAGSHEAKTIASRVEEAMAEEGLEKEVRDFKSHLTLGRVRSAKNKGELKRHAEELKIKPEVSHVSKIVLFKSELTKEGAIHTPLIEFELTG